MEQIKVCSEIRQCEGQLSVMQALSVRAGPIVCGYGGGWRGSAGVTAGQNTERMKKYWKRWKN